MILEIIAALLCGVIFGAITGIIPGIHINLISILVLGASGFLLTKAGIQPLIIASFLVAMAITHTFVDFIPSIFLGAPDENNFLSILPGHEMLIQGKGYDAVIYTAYGGLSALLIILLFTPAFLYFLPKAYSYVERIMPIILILASFFLIYFEKKSRFLAAFIFIFSGVLGLASSLLPLKESLLPLFTGLFGISSLITSIAKKQKIPEQKISRLKNIRISKKSFLKSVFASLIASPLCSFLPGLGSGQAAVIGSEITGELDRREFLILLGSIGTIVTGLSFVTLSAINKARTGIAVAVGNILTLSPAVILVLTTVIIAAGILAFAITILLAKLFSSAITKINYRLLSSAVLILLLVIILFFSGWLGLLVSCVSAILGLACINAGIRRTHLMGCLIIPSIIFYLI